MVIAAPAPGVFLSMRFAGVGTSHVAGFLRVLSSVPGGNFWITAIANNLALAYSSKVDNSQADTTTYLTFDLANSTLFIVTKQGSRDPKFDRLRVMTLMRSRQQ